MGPDPPLAADAERRRAGLCADCQWARRVTSARGGTFLLCRRSETDPAYPKYPALPRWQCMGYEREGSAPAVQPPR